MTTLKFENNKIYSTSTLCEKTDVFEIVEKIPAGFFVWNIGENMGTHEYIPVCEDLHPEDKDNYEINTATLKAVKVAPDEWEKLNKAGDTYQANTGTKKERINRDEKNRIKIYMGSRKQEQQRNKGIKKKKYIF